MARPAKYDWDEIKRHYQSGMTQKEIHTKFKCPKSSISEKIKKDNWDISEIANSVVQGKIKVSENLTELNEQDSELARVASQIGDERAKNTELIHNSAKFFLGKAVTKAKDPKATMNDIYQGSKVVTETGMNLGVIPRHANSQINVNTQNNLQQNTNIELTEEQAKKKALDLGVPLSALTSH